MAVVNPFEGLINGVLQGHAIATHLRQQAMQEEAFQRAQAREEQEAQLRDIEATQMIRSAGRPVTGNAVQDVAPGVVQNITRQMSTPAGSSTSVGSIDDLPSTRTTLTPAIADVTYSRPVDKSRLLTYKTRSGETVQSEAYTPEELMQRQIAHASMLSQSNAQSAALADVLKKRADRGYYESELARRGVLAPEVLVRAGLAQDGDKVLPEDLKTLIPAAQGVLTPTHQVLAPGGSLVEMPKPAVSSTPVTPAPAATAPPSAEAPPAGTNPLTNPLLEAGATFRQARQDFINSAKSAGSSASTPQPAAPGPKVVATATPLPKTEAELAIVATDPKRTPAEREAAGAALKRLDQSKRESRPVTTINMGIPGMPTAPTKLTGEAYLATLPPSVAAQVKAIDLGDADLPPATARTKAAQQLRDAVFQYNPDYSKLLAQQRKETLHEFNSTSNAKAGGQQLALNTLIHHADLYLDVANALKNRNWRKGNEIYNRVASEFGAAPPTDANLVARFLAGETGKVATGGVPAEGEINGILANLSTNAGPDQIASAGNRILQIAGGRMVPLKERVAKAKLEKYVDVVGPDAKAILQRRGYDPETMKPVGAGGPPAGAKISVTDPNGGVHWFTDQASANKFKKDAGIK